ncbi:hypothetical protein KY345_01610 [Candidatus Woesearchaeota archaeon]|nr:hypothetical protein [Candidatus Woesearchaeota archaeon]
MEDKVIAFLRLKGPSLPSDIARQLKTNTFFAGAHLSTLLEKNQVFVSNIRIGSSPLYYLKDHKYRLEQFSKYLGEKDKKTFDLLKQKKVIRDRTQDPLTRVSLRNIKDFAVQLNITVNNNREIFWKFYSLKDEEAHTLIKNIIEPVKEKPKEIKKQPEIKEKPKEPEKPAIIKEEKIIKQPIPEKPKIKTAILEKPKPIIQEKLIQKPIEKIQLIIKGEFYNQIMNSFSDKNITIQSTEMIKKNKEYDFIIKIPSPAGTLTYYCKAKTKKRVSEGDLSSAILKAQSKHLPALFLTDGDLTKKAEKSLNEELKDQIKLMKIQ